ncbi:hypothetical protein [Kangiella koreensis]|uniref:Uncharacterized protein n=1 Tax=Kangiella koreensis (strain DSM 16069 / JCM 12317 / KCTC 12182 / SW-125) TaxID=523791 RepID=C7RB15_KANKD|nr:hypothetical protein [Kangiella koreensis]ACV26457.1 hypothetical protein Kkor_1038 [Kangiella koreensis DSM 16069]
MNSSTKRPQGKSIALNVNTQFIEDTESCTSKEQDIPPTKIYAFSSQGQLLAESKVKGSGTTKLSLKAHLNDAVTVAVGPETKEKIRSLSDLKRFRPKVSSLKLTEQVLDLDVYLPSKLWLCWFLSRCVVPGAVYRDYGISGPSDNFPIANATVEVYEVDPFWLWIPKLPDNIIDKLKDIIVDGPHPIDPPIPPFPPILPDFPEPQPSFFEPALELRSDEGYAKLKALSQLPDYQNLKVMAQTQNNFEFRQTLLEIPKLVLPFICFYFPRWVTMQKLTEAITDECGRFTAVFFRGCNNTDQPDLYFKVKQQVPGKGEVTIYEKKPIPCYTYWNYQCGTEVTLRSTHPDAIASSGCKELPEGNYVVFKTVGITGMHRIYGCGASGSNSTNKGLLNANNPGSPFGSGLYFSADFSPSLRSNGIRYYKLSVKGPSTGGDFVPMRHEMFRFYTDDSGGTPMFKSYSLGPDKDGLADLYEIPDVDAPNNTPWQNGAGSMFYNSLSIGYWDSVGDQSDAERLNNAGMYEIQMQLFDASGNEVNIGSGDFYYLLATDGSVTDPVEHNNAKDFNLVKAGSGSHLSLIFELRIDNNQCVGQLQTPHVGGTTAGACCGTLDYDVTGSIVNMPFVAEHPHGYANYAFSIKRGSIPLIGLTEAGKADLAPPNKQQLASVATLLSNATTSEGGVIQPAHLPAGCADKVCTNAAFAEHLYVNAWATNGISQINAYDAHDFRAFALMESDDS